MSWWQIIVGVYVVCCITMVVWYFREIHRGYQTDRKFFEIVRSEDWEV